MLSSYPSDMKAIPAEVKLPNVIFDIKSQSVDALPANPTFNSTIPINSQIYQYDSYPDAFVFFCHKTTAGATASDANSFLKLDKGDSNKVLKKHIEIKLSVPGSTIFAEEKGTTFEEATDLALEALKSQIKKFKDKRTEVEHKKREIPAEEEVVEEDF